MDNKKIWIKADANETIATGHIRRCMTIAKELTSQGASVEFILSDEESADILKSLCNDDGVCYEARILHTLFSSPMEDIPVLKEIFAEEKPDFFLMDSYHLDIKYFEAVNDIIKKYSLPTKTGYIDDLYKFDYPVDMVINYDLEIPENFYTAPTQLLGPEYAPLREQFVGSDYEISEKAHVAFLATGGTDPYHVIGRILKESYAATSPCRKTLYNADFRFEIVLGALFEEDYKKELREMASHNSAISIHESVSDMASIMKRADLALSAGGTTIYELCAVGVPTVVFSMADNQMEFVKAFDKAGAVKYAGDIRTDRRLVEKIVTWGTAAVENRGFRKRMSEKAKSIIDGKGAVRIARGIMELV